LTRISLSLRRGCLSWRQQSQLTTLFGLRTSGSILGTVDAAFFAVSPTPFPACAGKPIGFPVKFWIGRWNFAPPVIAKNRSGAASSGILRRWLLVICVDEFVLDGGFSAGRRKRPSPLEHDVEPKKPNHGVFYARQRRRHRYRMCPCARSLGITSSISGCTFRLLGVHIGFEYARVFPALLPLGFICCCS